MMVGLPGCGKTTWVDKFCQHHQEQRWHVLSAPTVLEHMKVKALRDCVMVCDIALIRSLHFRSRAFRERSLYRVDGTS